MIEPDNIKPEGLLIIPPKTIRTLAASVADTLWSWGEKPVGVSVIDEGRGLHIAFEIISEHPRWLRSVEVSAARCRADWVHDQLNAWRKRIRTNLERGQISGVTARAIETFGRARVEQAVAHRSRF